MCMYVLVVVLAGHKNPFVLCLVLGIPRLACPRVNLRHLHVLVPVLLIRRDRPTRTVPGVELDLEEKYRISLL